MSLVKSLLSPTRMRADGGWSGFADFGDVVGWISGNGFPLLNQTWAMNKEVIEGDFAGLVHGAYQSNGVVFACLMTRFMLFAEARFAFQQLRGGRPGDLFGTPDLGIIERPEPGMTTGDLLTAGMLDADLAGDWFGIRRPGRIKRLRPDWTSVIVGSKNRATEYPGSDPDAEVVGYSFSPNGAYGSEVWSFGPDEIAHFMPIRDPLARYRGMPLPTAVLREIAGDSAATAHKRSFFENAATPNLIIRFPPTMPKPKAQEAIDLFEQEHTGAYNAYRTMYLLGGAEAQAVGKDLQQMDFASVQGKGETRIAAAMNVHPVIVGLSEGLQGSSLNAGNFGAARRLHADKMLRPAWRNFAGSLETIVPPLPGSRLWYDERDVPFLREDIKDAAEVLSIQATAMRTLGDGGWDHDAVVDGVTSNDLRRLAGAHTGMVPVQLQAPGSSAVAAQRDFQPQSGAWIGSEIRRGDLFGLNHPLVAAFPSLFAPALGYDQRAVRVWSQPVAEWAASVEITSEPSMADLMARALDILAARPPVPAPVVNNYLPAGPDVSMSSAPITFERGAIEVGVQPPHLTMADGAIRVESGAVNVAPSEVHFAEGAFRSEVNVETPSLTIAEGAVQVSVEPAAVSVPVNVEPAQTHFAEGAIRVDAPVTVEAAQIEITTPPVTIAEGAVQVTVEAAEAPPPPAPRTVRKTVKRDEAGRIVEMIETEETD